MEDGHLIADIIMEVLEEDPKINGVTYEGIFKKAAEKFEMASFRAQRAIEFLVSRGVVATTPFGNGVVITSKFTYGYKYGYKRLWYDEFEGVPLGEKLMKLKALKDNFNKGDVPDMDYYYVLGRIDQTSFSAGYI
jgi:hypothetical protein